MRTYQMLSFTLDFLTLGHRNGVVFNIAKFVFCQVNVEFAGLSITADGVAPSKLNQCFQLLQTFPHLLP